MASSSSAPDELTSQPPQPRIADPPVDNSTATVMEADDWKTASSVLCKEALLLLYQLPKRQDCPSFSCLWKEADYWNDHEIMNAALIQRIGGVQEEEDVLKKLDEAEGKLLDAWSLVVRKSEKIPDNAIHRVNILSARGEVATRKGDHHKAEHCYKQALRTWVGDEGLRIADLNFKVALCLKIGQEAIAYLAKARSIYQTLLRKLETQASVVPSTDPSFRLIQKECARLHVILRQLQLKLDNLEQQLLPLPRKTLKGRNSEQPALTACKSPNQTGPPNEPNTHPPLNMVGIDDKPKPAVLASSNGAEMGDAGVEGGTHGIFKCKMMGDSFFISNSASLQDMRRNSSGIFGCKPVGSSFPNPHYYNPGDTWRNTFGIWRNTFGIWKPERMGNSFNPNRASSEELWNPFSANRRFEVGRRGPYSERHGPYSANRRFEVERRGPYSANRRFEVERRGPWGNVETSVNKCRCPHWHWG